MKDISQVVRRAAEIFGCAADDLKGMTVNQLLTELDRVSGVYIYWGGYSQQDLDRII